MYSCSAWMHNVIDCTKLIVNVLHQVLASPSWHKLRRMVQNGSTRVRNVKCWGYVTLELQGFIWHDCQNWDIHISLFCDNFNTHLSVQLGLIISNITWGHQVFRVIPHQTRSSRRLCRGWSSPQLACVQVDYVVQGSPRFIHSRLGAFLVASVKSCNPKELEYPAESD